MGARWLKVLFACLAGAVAWLALAWLLLSGPVQASGRVSIRFAGFSNATTGAITARFTVSNTCRHPLLFAGGAVQVRQAKGWPRASVYGNPVGPVFVVAPNSQHTFAVGVSNLEGALWRVPLSYQRADTRIERLTEPLTGALGFRRDQTCTFTNTPELLGFLIIAPGYGAK